MIIFNRGWLCPACGPVADSKKRSIAKISYDCCKICLEIVTPWTRPLNQMAGRCFNCAAAHFENKIENHDLVRSCRTCEEVYNIDTEKVITPGKKEFRYES